MQIITLTSLKIIGHLVFQLIKHVPKSFAQNVLVPSMGERFVSKTLADLTQSRSMRSNSHLNCFNRDTSQVNLVPYASNPRLVLVFQSAHLFQVDKLAPQHVNLMTFKFSYMIKYKIVKTFCLICARH